MSNMSKLFGISLEATGSVVYTELLHCHYRRIGVIKRCILK
jgi:hypothetical protein